jgi:glycosyltransferase involved in cell wall biosynthesis
MSHDASLTIGLATAGRPHTYEKAINSLRKNVDYPYELVVVDNTPEINSEVSKSNDVDHIITPNKMIGPGESRQRIVDSTDSDIILFVDDDTIPYQGVVKRLVDSVSENDNKMASGVFWKEDSFIQGRAVGRIFQKVCQNGLETLVDIPVFPRSVVDHGISTWKVDMGMPMIAIQREIFDIATFDSRYDFFYEWIDFFYQTYQHNEKVQVITEATFQHLDGEYSGKTIRNVQSRQEDREKFCTKWDTELYRKIEISRSAWQEDRSLLRLAAQYYANNGMIDLLRRIRHKWM